jgi:hypothetical protein
MININQSISNQVPIGNKNNQKFDSTPRKSSKRISLSKDRIKATDHYPKIFSIPRKEEGGTVRNGRADIESKEYETVSRRPSENKIKGKCLTKPNSCNKYTVQAANKFSNSKQKIDATKAKLGKNLKVVLSPQKIQCREPFLIQTTHIR